MYPYILLRTPMNLSVLSAVLFPRITILNKYIWTVFLTTAKLEGQDVTGTLDQLKAVGEKFGVSFIISMSLDKEDVPAAFQDSIITAL